MVNLAPMLAAGFGMLFIARLIQARPTAEALICWAHERSPTDGARFLLNRNTPRDGDLHNILFFLFH